jgi:hypothetical protein
MCRELVFLRRGELLSNCEKRIEVMEKEILYFTGRKRERARRKYLRLIKSCSKECGLEDPIYLKRR